MMLYMLCFHHKWVCSAADADWWDSPSYCSLKVSPLGNHFCNSSLGLQMYSTPRLEVHTLQSGHYIKGFLSFARVKSTFFLSSGGTQSPAVGVTITMYLMMMQSIMSLHMTHPHSSPDAGAVCRGGHDLKQFNLMFLRQCSISVPLVGLYHLCNHATKTVSASCSWRITAVVCWLLALID